MIKRVIQLILYIFILLSQNRLSFGYPIDGYPTTGIRRLERWMLIIKKQLSGPLPVPGARKSLSEIRLQLTGLRGDSLDVLPPADVELQKKIDSLFPNRDESYALALLDITPGKPIRFAKRQANHSFSPGSVGKLLVAAGLFSELQKLYPESVEKRISLLRTRMVMADQWIHNDDHQIPFFDIITHQLVLRPAKDGDIFSLYEWVDHMLSASANSAASIVWKEAILMREFGRNYPPSREEEKIFFEKTSKENLKKMAMSIVNDPLTQIGITSDEWQLGSFFTGIGKKIVPSGGKSQATPLGILKFLIALERGKIVDTWSSLEIKRLIYTTTKRIRYASSPALTQAAVYFKSGSLYRCKPEPDFKCGKYMGNVDNYMNSVVIVEHPEGRTYLVVLMSNVLRKNSAAEHQTLATFIDRILAK